MTAHAVHRSQAHQPTAHQPAPRNAAHRAATRRRKYGVFNGVFTWPFAFIVLLVAGATAFISYALWPTWPSDPVALDAPALPITVAGVLFEIPPAAIRETVQRHPGEHDRVDLAFAWPSLTPPQADDKPDRKPPLSAANAIAAAAEPEKERLFVTIEGLNGVLPPLERLRTIYPRYVEGQTSTSPDGLASLSFRSGTPYDGEDLIYSASSPEQFFARCTRRDRAVPGTCINERALDTAEITMRFPRDWLIDWRKVAVGLDRLAGQLHPDKK
ncbi:MAG: hypothetical protein WAK55_19850 [Xanthobacteraceae bacterium]